MAKSLGILGRKLGMIRIFNSDGSATPVTVVAAGPCPVIQIKDENKDGYNAIQIGFGDIAERKVNKPEAGHLAKANKGSFRHLREIRLDSVDGYEVGQDITVTEFAPGDVVKVTGTSKGKGFQGVMKRWNFIAACPPVTAMKRFTVRLVPWVTRPILARCSRARRWLVTWALGA